MRILDYIVDKLSRSDEILETNRVYIKVDIPPSFYSRLSTFLKGKVWLPEPGVILAGGALFTLLSDRDLNTVDDDEDLDIWIYGNNDDIYYRLFESFDCKAFKMDGRKTTIFTKRPIQIIRSEFNIPSQIPNFFDIDHLKGYLAYDGLYLHPAFIRALKFNRVKVDLRTIKVRRILKCLRYDFLTYDDKPLWEEIQRFLEVDEGVKYNITEHNLWRLKGEHVYSKEHLIHLLKWDLQQKQDVNKTQYSFSIREKALIISLDDADEVKKEFLEKFDALTYDMDVRKPDLELARISQPIILRLKNIEIRKGKRDDYFTMIDENEVNPFMVELDAIMMKHVLAFEAKYALYIMGRIIGPKSLLKRSRYHPGKYIINLKSELMDFTGLPNVLQVDLDLQVDSLCTAHLDTKFLSHVIDMKVLD